MIYHPHGDVDFQQYDDVIFVTLKGSVNLEMFKIYNEKMLSYEKCFRGRRWAQILDLRQFDLAPEDVFEAIKKEERSRKDFSTRCSDQVIITESAFMKSYLDKHTSAPELVTPDHCTTIEEAFTILESKGYAGTALYKKSAES